MIISVSRRNDIPAFFSEWFYNRIKEGFVLVRNPMNPHQISEITLRPDVVDCFVFWTKNPENMIPKLSILDEFSYKYYFQFTLNSYDKTIEPNVPPKKNLIETFVNLSEKIGKDRVIWRYDPILLTEKFSGEYHKKYFEYLMSKLHKHTQKCVISFVDFYKKSQTNMKSVTPISPNEAMMFEIAKAFQKIANDFGVVIETCSEEIELASLGINHGKCIDDQLIEKICNGKINVKKDKNQRAICGCVESIDIGAYNTCKHGCLYCYATFNRKIVAENYEQHNPLSPLLFGEVGPSDKINKRKMKSIIDRQLDLL